MAHSGPGIVAASWPGDGIDPAGDAAAGADGDATASALDTGEGADAELAQDHAATTTKAIQASSIRGGGAILTGLNGATLQRLSAVFWPSSIAAASPNRGSQLARWAAHRSVCALVMQSHTNACQAATAGFDLSELQACPSPTQGYLSCGAQSCEHLPPWPRAGHALASDLRPRDPNREASIAVALDVRIGLPSR